MICKKNLERIGFALHEYCQDTENPNDVPCRTKKEYIELRNKGIMAAPSFPAGQQTSTGNMDLLRSLGYINDYSLFICPSSGDKPQTFGKLSVGHLSYVYKEGLNDFWFGSMTGSPDSAIVSDNASPSNHHQFGFLLFIDGHVTGYTGENWVDNSGHPGWSSRKLPQVD